MNKAAQRVRHYTIVVTSLFGERGGNRTLDRRLKIIAQGTAHPGATLILHLHQTVGPGLSRSAASIMAAKLEIKKGFCNTGLSRNKSGFSAEP